MITITIEGAKARATGQLDTMSIRVISALSGRKVWASSKSVSFESSAGNLRTIRETLKDRVEWVDKSGELALIDEMETFARQDQKAEKAKSKWKPKMKLRAHQQKCIDISWKRKAYAVLFDMGLGKTALLIANCGMLFAEGEIDGVLVLAPKGVDRQWHEEEIKKHADPAFKVNSFMWNGKAFDKSKIKKGQLNFYLMNIDAIRGKGGAAAADFAKSMNGRCMMIIDESHAIKGHGTQRTKAAIELGKLFSHRRIATGTPLSKNVMDFFSQFKFLDERILGQRYASSYRSRYCIMGGFEGREIIGVQRLEELNGLIAPHSFRLTKEEALDLPPKIFIRREYDLDAKSRQHYNILKKELMTELSDGTILTVVNAAVKVMRLQQIVCGYLPREDGELEAISGQRIEELLEIISSVEGPVIVWARFKEDIRRIKSALDKARETSVTYYGETSRKDRDIAKAAFLSDKARVFISNTASGGTGLNLQGKCRNVVYYSNGTNAQQRWQSEDRTHRDGMEGSVTYFDLVARKTVDVLTISNIANKKSLSDLTLDQIRKALAEN